MAEGAEAQQTPTFKLVLVGDGGTGKVRRIQDLLLFPRRGAYGTRFGGQKRQAPWLTSGYRLHS